LHFRALHWNVLDPEQKNKLINTLKACLEERAYDGSQRAKTLRQRIQGIRIKRLRWDDETFYFILAGLGYGTSLRALDCDELQELWDILKSYKREAASEYDKQGKYMYALQMRAGWSDRQLREYMCLHFRALHWNVLDPEQKNKLINTLKACLEER